MMRALFLSFLKITLLTFFILANSIPLAWSETSCHAEKSGSGGNFKGEAAVVFFYFGDSYLKTLAQETLDLSLTYKNTQYQALLLDQNETGTTKFSKSKAINNAEDLYQPTRENFFEAIRDVIEQGYVANIWIFSHGSAYTRSNGEEVTYFVAKDGIITNEDLIEEFGTDGCGELPIRMVYTVACFSSGMNDAWIDLGAKAVMGARLVNFYPTQYTRFATDWSKGTGFSKALANSNTSGSRSLVNAYIGLEGLKYSYKGPCGLAPNVLGKNSCAEYYFTNEFFADNEYQSNKSGKDNMAYASTKIISGNASLTYKTVQTWQVED